MLYVLIAPGAESAVSALIAGGVQGVSSLRTSAAQMQLAFVLNANGQCTAAGAALYATLVSSGYVAIQVSAGPSVYELSTNPADGSTSLFFFPSKVGRLLGMYLGGVIQLPADCSVTVDGGVQLASYVPKPVTGFPVTASFIPAA